MSSILNVKHPSSSWLVLVTITTSQCQKWTSEEIKHLAWRWRRFWLRFGIHRDAGHRNFLQDPQSYFALRCTQWPNHLTALYIHLGLHLVKYPVVKISCKCPPGPVSGFEHFLPILFYWYSRMTLSSPHPAWCVTSKNTENIWSLALWAVATLKLIHNAPCGGRFKRSSRGGSRLI